MTPWVLLARPKTVRTWVDMAGAWVALFGPGPTHGRFWVVEGCVYWQEAV